MRQEFMKEEIENQQRGHARAVKLYQRQVRSSGLRRRLIYGSAVATIISMAISVAALAVAIVALAR